MAVESSTLGPGQLTLGETASEREWGAAVRNARVVPAATEGETLTVLSGDETSDEGEETWTLEGTVLQSYDADSLIKWCADNSGTEVPFTYTARNDEALEVSGTVKVRAIAYGGDVKTRNTSDFNFKIIGKPVFDVGA